MRNVIKLLAVVMICLSTQSFAQTLKFGHINRSEVIVLMPERDSAVAKLEKYGKELQETFQAMQSEFNRKYEEYNQKAKDWLPAVLEAKEKELSEINQRLQQFSSNAQQELAQMEQQLMTPVIQKATDAINKVSKANGFTYVFDLSAGSLAYVNEAASENIMPLVRKELGIPADKQLPVAQN